MTASVSSRRREYTIVGTVILLLSLIEPLTHLWIAFFPPAGTVPTGMHTGDSAIYLHSMACFSNGFHSPFATCHATYGVDSFRYYTPPHLLLYAVFGAIGSALGISPFQFLGLINGLGGALFLAAIYALFREVLPRLALRAFLLFAFPGGLGGLLFFVTGAFGFWHHPDFTACFERFAHYELIEGQTLSPVLLMPRFYYTIPLALGLTGLTCFIRAVKGGGLAWVIAAALLNGLATLLHLRVGPVLWGVAVLYVLCAGSRPWRKTMPLLAMHALPTLAGAALFVCLLRWPPVFTQNALQVTSMALWWLPFLSLTIFHWPFLVRSLSQGANVLSTAGRLAAFAAAGYLLVFTVAYAGYLAYFGNWLRGGDTSAAIAVSDWALTGALLGLFFAWRYRRHAAEAIQDGGVLGWLTIWFLGLLALAPSAFGHGWLLQCTPQRLLVLLGPPLALLTAYGLEGLSLRTRRTTLALLLGAGLISLSAGVLFFQGSLGREPGKGPFAYLHYEVVRVEEAQLLADLPPGTTLSPPWSPIAFGEILSLRPGVQVLGGPGAMNLGDQPLDRLQEGIARFFDVQADDTFRVEFVRQWCVDFIYCPDTCPVDERTRQHFDGTPWLRRIAQSGKGAIYQVMPIP